MRRRIPETRKIRELLGWRPTRTLDEILDDVIEAQRAPGTLVEDLTMTTARDPREDALAG